MIESNVTLSAESLDLLKSIKGKTLVNIRTLNGGDRNRTYGGCFVLDFDDGSSVVLYDDYVAINYYHDEYFGNRWEATALFCRSLDDATAKRKLYDQTIKPLRIDEIEVVTDEVEMNAPNEGDLIVAVDAAIVLRSGSRFMTFSLDEEHYDTMWLIRSENKSVDELRPIEKIEFAWADDAMRKEDGITIKVTRSSRNF